MSTEKRRGWMRKIIDREVSPDTHLIKTAVFWLLILPPLIGGVSLAVSAGVYDLVYWQFTPESYNLIIKDFKMPLGVMGLSIPLAALSAAIHRSVQTSRQINEQYSQNIFSNHLQHRNYFFKFIEDFEPFKGMKISVPKLYEVLFPRAVDGDLEPNKVALNNFLSEILHMNKIVNSKLNQYAHENKIIIESEEIKDAIGQYKLLLEWNTGKSYKFEEIDRPKDLFNLISSTLSESEVVADALIKCANFHRNYIDVLDNSALEKLESYFISSKSVIEILRLKQNIYRELRDALNQYTDQDFHFRKDQNNPQHKFKSRLSNLPTNLGIEPGSDDFRAVVANYFNKEERGLLKENLPIELKMSL